MTKKSSSILAAHHRGSLRCLLSLLAVGTALLGGCADAKTVSGDFKLSGLMTEHVMGSFAVAAGHTGTMTVDLISKDGPYSAFSARMYKDDEWPKFKKALLCDQKTKLASTTEPVVFARDRKSPGQHKAHIAMKMDNSKGDRPRYYYFAVDECQLEMYMHDAQVPKVHYKVQTWDEGSHLSADENHLITLHTMTMLFSGILATLLGLSIMVQMMQKSSVHAAMFLVTAAAICDSASSMLELMHLRAYSSNGVGSYALDALSAHMEALCDSMVTLMLLFVASGWTLPSDVISVQQNATLVQKVIGGLQNPFRALASGSPGAVFAMFIIAAHLILAQWGRIYNDDFDSYHDLEHLPGTMLMLLRMFLGLCLIICCFQTRSRCPISLHGFYVKLAIVGTAWFQSLPIVIWACNAFVSYHLRHAAVGKWCAIVQTSSLVLLSWLVTSQSSSSYHKLSHMSSGKDNLTESLSGAGGGDIGADSGGGGGSGGILGGAASRGLTFSMGKSKVRLD
eukprot:CAMPEP_0198126598 /NCGR_PEP_ID=MMETSP1442-20131203/45217_1 /TAXON_ID= /ORGANISM="Craspedostauros australis, Strain CCMP3328" /LENGTH=507 /DNA_ID=CAMNT_0043786407 /DNA_START=87 /DNA_END=1610 /DNA_ORIENTATION=+